MLLMKRKTFRGKHTFQALRVLIWLQSLWNRLVGPLATTVENYNCRLIQFWDKYAGKYVVLYLLRFLAMAGIMHTCGMFYSPYTLNRCCYEISMPIVGIILWFHGRTLLRFYGWCDKYGRRYVLDLQRTPATA